MTPRRLIGPVLAVTLTVALAACGSDSSHSGMSMSPTPTTSTSTSTSSKAEATPSSGAATLSLNETDVEFLQGMIPHHEQAIEMAEIALDPKAAASPEVVALATRIKAAQDPEVQQMTQWLWDAGQNITMDTSAGHDMSTMDGMMTADQMDAMAAATGADFDRMWLEMMVAHHQGAISQSQTVKANGANPDVRTLADQIIAAQQAEITEMQALLNG